MPAESDAIVMDDSVLDDVFFSPVCTKCIHLHFTADMKHTCDAFPGGIPEDIWKGINNHKKPYSGDKGIQFTKRK